MWVKDVFNVKGYKAEIEMLYRIIEVKEKYIKELEKKIECAEKNNMKNLNTILKQKETINKLWGMEND